MYCVDFPFWFSALIEFCCVYFFFYSAWFFNWLMPWLICEPGHVFVLLEIACCLGWIGISWKTSCQFYSTVNPMDWFSVISGNKYNTCQNLKCVILETSKHLPNMTVISEHIKCGPSRIMMLDFKKKLSKYVHWWTWFVEDTCPFYKLISWKYSEWIMLYNDMNMLTDFWRKYTCHKQAYRFLDTIKKKLAKDNFVVAKACAWNHSVTF